MASIAKSVDMNARLNRNLGLLQSGSAITIDISTPAGQKQKFRTIFVGYLPKQYVLIQFPDTSKLGKFAQYMTQGMGITVRGLIEGHEGSVVAFISNIKQTIQIPSRLIVLEFPKTVTLQNLRSSIRIDTQIKTKVNIGKEYWQATMTDLSVHGCHLDISNGDALVLADDKKIEIIIEELEALANIKLMADICNVKQHSHGVSFGVKFMPESHKQVTKLLHHTVTGEGL